INAGSATYAVPGHAEVREGADYRFLDAVDVFLDVVTGAAQVDQRIGHHLAGAVVGHLPAAIRLHDRGFAGVEYMVSLAGQTLRVDRRVFADPELVGRIRRPLVRRLLHRRIGPGVVDAAQQRDLQGAQSTTLTIGWLESARYRLSSCSRLVA